MWATCLPCHERTSEPCVAKEYRERGSHLRNNPSLVMELGLKKASSKYSIHSTACKIGLDTLA